MNDKMKTGIPKGDLENPVKVNCSYTRMASVASLVANPRNPNKHPPGQIELLAKIIQHQGWRAPITVSKRSGFVVVGHGRLEAARLLGLETAPVDEQDFETEADEWAHLVADNRLAELAETDGALLKDLLLELDTGAFDMDLSGFDAGELERVINSYSDVEGLDAEPQIDRAAELQKEWGTARGQIWELGEHRLMCGDSTSNDDVDRLMCGERADICFTSPPYGAGNVAKLRDHYVRGAKKRDSFYQDHKDDPAEWLNLMAGWFAAIRPSAQCVLCNVQMLADNKTDLVRWVADRADDLVDVIIWDKIHAAPQMQSGVMSNTFEFLFVFGGNGSRSVPFADWHGTVSNVVRVDPRGKNDNADNHRAVMPIELPLWTMKTLCPKAKSVVEPFCGTGTTIIACEQLGRKCRAIEISPAYVAVALQRFKDATGKQPKLING